ncbi:putative aldouronate transport system permease protein [Paenibacillus sp. UNCCL117]|uniref:ABC transporter permease n=1 Tax=unclassified Paenibacillus TaxID=185978 RepID=UPI00088D8E8C|nr:MULTISPECIES: ABC transporter permease subunit [unclassified Paenibacillus]SDE11837.1 putative aldouronate transport system permease protein [Paenibacillus sp. cl123]SFW60064.1 putative aldouronate transport system permease protein [Paenibacillus sp. UNCCL117]
MPNTGMSQVSSAAPHIAPGAVRRILKSLSTKRWLYLMMVPGLLYYAIFCYLPMGGLIIAFKDYNLLKGVWGSPWVGLDNFRIVFQSPDFFIVLKNTVLISVYRLLFNMLPDVMLALAFNEIHSRWFKKAIQTITYGPYFLSWVIVYGLVFSFLAPGSGLVTNWVRDMGWGQLEILTSEALFRPLLIVTDLWKNTGFGAIIYLAALASINQELYEAAVVDGAGRWRKLWHITLPGIREVFILMLILRLGHILDAGFDQVYIFLNARVYGVGDIIDTWVFRRGLESMEFSIGTTVGLFKSVIGFALVIAANKLAKKVGGSGIW